MLAGFESMVTVVQFEMRVNLLHTSALDAHVNSSPAVSTPQWHGDAACLREHNLVLLVTQQSFASTAQHGCNSWLICLLLTHPRAAQLTH